MTADSDKDCTHCLVCNSKVGVSTRNGVLIFNDSIVTISERPFVDTIAAILETNINEETIHSLVICRKCFILFNEVELFECKLTEIKLELCNNYKRTIKELGTFPSEKEHNNHDYIDNAQSTDIQDDSEYIAEEDKQKEKDETLVKSEEIWLEEEEFIESNPGEERTLTRSKVDTITESIQEQIVLRDGSSYTCLLCIDKNEKVTGNDNTIIRHMKMAHDARLYICDVCGQDFRKKKEFSLHLDSHVARERDFQCQICNRTFSNLRLFRIHKRMHYPVKSWSCETCGKGYSSKNLLEQHINTHTGIRPYVCEICGKDFTSKYTLKAHVKTHEERPRPFQCTRCNKRFLTQRDLNAHQRTHNSVKKHICHQCGKGFVSLQTLKTHNAVHTKPCKCRMCGRAFSCKVGRDNHERTHTGERPYACQFCGTTFRTTVHLRYHKQSVHYKEKRFKCDYCGEGFKFKRTLVYHIKRHTGEGGYKCKICTASFAFPGDLKQHMRAHTGEKPYSCEICGRAFSSKDNRNAHRFLHSDKKPYECLVCGRSFIRKRSLNMHMQTQGHLNDTVVVYPQYPKTEDEQVLGC